MLVDGVLDRLADPFADLLFEIGALEDFAALAIDNLALLVHDVVVLDQVTAGVEVVPFHLGLGALDLSRDQPRLDRLVIGDPQHVHHALDAFAAEDAHQVVIERQEETRGAGVTLAAGAAAELIVDAAALMPLGADDVEPATDGHAGAEHDVGAATGHVGRDRHCARLTGVGDDQRLPLVLLGVEDLVRHPTLLQQPGETLGLLDRHRADQHGASLAGDVLDLVCDRFELRVLGFVDEVGVIVPDHRLVGGDHDHLQLVDLVEPLGLGGRRARHAGQLGVEAEIVLVGDGGQRLSFLLDLDALFRLHRLVQTVRPAATRLLAAGELVDDDDLAVLDQVVAVAVEEGGGLERLVDLVRLVDVVELIDVFDAGPALDLRDPLLRQRRRLRFLIDGVIVRGQPRDEAGVLVVLLGRLLALAGDDQWGARLVDEDAVHRVDDGEVQAPLDALREVDRHVVAQVVETELAVRAVGDVGLVGLRPRDRPQVLQPRVGMGFVEEFRVVEQRHLVPDDRHAHPQRVVDGPVPTSVASGQVVVDGDEVRALALQRIEVEGQHRDQGLALTGFHLGDLSLVQHDAAYHLDVEGSQADGPAGGLADHRKGLYQQVVERLTVLQPLAQLGRLRPQLIIGELLDQRLEFTDVGYPLEMPLDFPRVRIA